MIVLLHPITSVYTESTTGGVQEKEHSAFKIKSDPFRHGVAMSYAQLFLIKINLAVTTSHGRL